MSKKVAVIGLGCGDEGKGMVTSSLVPHYQNPLVVRFSGGHQAGHTVHVNGMSHVFANFGSGTLQLIPTYWSDSCTVDPVGLNNELKVLVDTLKEDVHSVELFINRNCPITTPYDIQHNQQHDIVNGTCGVGFGATIEREENHYHLHFSDLFNEPVFKIKLKMIATEYYEGFHVDLSKFLDAVELIRSTEYLTSDVIHMVNDIPEEYSNIIFEGSQGLLLDKDIGFFPHVTRSSVGLGKLAYKYEPIDKVYYVTRAYQTRHGNGPMTNEDLELELDCTENESNVYNKYQGKFRKGVLDLNLLEYALNKDRSMRGFSTSIEENLVITCLDQVSKEYKITHDRKLIVFHIESDFITYIADALDIPINVYLSRSVNSGLELWEK